MARVVAPWDPSRGAGSWRLELLFQAGYDEEADYSFFSPSLPWLKQLSSREHADVCEDLRREGLALLACEGPEEALRLSTQVTGSRVSARVLEPDGTEFQPPQNATAKDRGLYATPRALTRFVVRSVDTLLQTHLGFGRGLASPKVRVVDPAAGPMNFVLEVYRRAAARQRRDHGRGTIPALLSEHLIPHCQGLEILPGPWAEGQRALGQWVERVSPGASPSRFPLFLADALAAPGQAMAGFLEPEAEAADRLRLREPLTVVLGNPPFRGSSRSRGPWIADLLRGYTLPDGRTEEGYFTLDGRALGERNVKWLHDDYVRFLRLAQWMIDQRGEGIVGFVLNHNFLEAPTFRGLRQSLLRTFDQIFALDLHGNQRRREVGPAGQRDENVFPGVAQGIAVLLLVKGGGKTSKAVHRADLYGTRREKLRTLARANLQSLAWARFEPRPSSYLFRFSDREREWEFLRGIALPEIFPLHSLGVVTGKDARVIAFRREDFEPRLVQAGRTADCRSVIRFLVRPFDLRHALYGGAAIERPRTAVMSHLGWKDNLGLLALRQSTTQTGSFVTRWVSGHKVVNSYAPNTVFPLFLRGEGGQAVPNLDPRIWDLFADRLGASPSPEDLFGYIYAVLQDPRYLSRFRELLRAGFPRIPLPETRQSFARGARLGQELIAIHLCEDPRLASSPVFLDGDPRAPLTIDPTVVYEEPVSRVTVNRRGLAFMGITPEVWDYKVGSYRVLERWLRARTGRRLSLRTIREFRWIAEAVRMSLAVKEQIQEIG